MVAIPAGEHATLAQLENQRLTFGGIVQRRCERTDAGILIRKRKSSFSLVRGNQIEALELRNVAPPAGHLTIRHFIRAGRDSFYQLRDGATVEHPVPEVTEH